MPAVEAVVTVPVPPELTFAVSQIVAPVRYRWDPCCADPEMLAAARRTLAGS